MRDLFLLIGLFVAAVVVGLWIHPLFAIFFLVVAKFGAIIWTHAAEAYRLTYAEKRKRRHILTADGEQLDVISADDRDSEPISSGIAHG